MTLPRDVQRVVKPSGKVYYYYAPGRGSAGAGRRVALGSDMTDPEFWRRLREASSRSRWHAIKADCGVSR